MTQDFINCMTTILTQGFRLFTCFEFPGVNFSPAVLMFGILSFGLSISVIHGIMTITATGMENKFESLNRARAKQSKGSKD